ncbi:MAG: arsenate reductase ArsC [Arenicellales bacterium]
MNDDRTYNVLFLCTGNSARSIFGEAILNRLGQSLNQGRFTAYSAGSHPAGRVNPHALDLLDRLEYPTAGLRSKSWEEFSGSDTPKMDFIFTVCDDAARETCPVWPGHPMTAHWGVPDPAAVKGSEAEIGLAFADAYRMLNNRIKLFINLPLASLDELSLRSRLAEVGRTLRESA